MRSCPPPSRAPQLAFQGIGRPEGQGRADRLNPPLRAGAAPTRSALPALCPVLSACCSRARALRRVCAPRPIPNPLRHNDFGRNPRRIEKIRLTGRTPEGIVKVSDE